MSDMASALEWFARHPVGSDKATAVLHAVISELRLVHGIEQVVTEGFCWGAWLLSPCGSWPAT